MDYNGNKGFRLLNIHERLNRGERLNKTALAQQFGVTEKTIQRDIDDLRAYLAETHLAEQEMTIQYSRSQNGYYLARLEREWLTNEETLAVCKILLESRAFCREELDIMLNKLITQASPNERRQAEEIIQSERFYYAPLRHGKKLLEVIWELSLYITKNEIIEIRYTRQDEISRKHQIKPVAILFSEYYFYLIAFLADDSKDFPTVFRIDRLIDFKGTGKKFYIPYRERFNDGEFRKRVQFMYAGELQRVRFEYSGPSVEAVLDRLPTARVLSEEKGRYTIQAEVYGSGIDMWLRSQGGFVKRLN